VFRLSAVIGDYPHTRALHRGEASSPKLDLKIADLRSAPEAIEAMVRSQAFDVCEMPVVTFLQAHLDRRPLVLLPATLVGRFQHGAAIYDCGRGEIAPDSLAGLRIGVRSWARTTGVWVRGILADDYGFDPTLVDWVTFEASHLPAFADPSRRAPADKHIVPMLLTGELDVVIGETSQEARVRTLIPDPAAAAKEWHRKRRLVPINHMVVVRQDLARDHPWIVEEFYDLLWRSKHAGGVADSGVDMAPFGVDANRPALELIIAYAAKQGIISRPVAVDDLFDDRVRRLRPG